MKSYPPMVSGVYVDLHLKKNLTYVDGIFSGDSVLRIDYISLYPAYISLTLISDEDPLEGPRFLVVARRCLLRVEPVLCFVLLVQEV